MTEILDLPVGLHESWVKRRILGPDVNGKMQIVDLIDLAHPGCPINGFPLSPQERKMLDDNRAISIQASGLTIEPRQQR